MYTRLLKGHTTDFDWLKRDKLNFFHGIFIQSLTLVLSFTYQSVYLTVSLTTPMLYPSNTST